MDKVISGNNIINLQKRGFTRIVSAKLDKSIMSEDKATYEVESREILPIKINDTIEIFGKIYRVNNLPRFIKTSSTTYKYSIDFEGKMWDLLRCQYFNADSLGFKTDAEFSLIGTIDLFLSVLKNNLDRLDPNWVIGTYQVGETKTIAFSKDSCLSALQKICQEFKIEFRIDEANGKQIINTGDFGQKLNYSFEYGKGKGLYGLERSNVDENSIINRLYVSGGSQNLPTAYRNYSDSLKLPGVEYLEDPASIAEIGLKEGFAEFPEIYPHRTGTITALGPTKFIFHDSSLDFDLNALESDGVTTQYLIPGTPAKVHFNTGNLAGYTFEIKKNGYNHATKQFEIIPITDEQGLKFPSENASAFQFQIGDEYVLLDIFYPQSYLDAAEAELLVKAEEEFSKSKSPKVNYKLLVDDRYLKSKIIIPGDVPFNLNDTVTIIDPDLNINREIKIVSFSRDLLNPFRFDINIADSYEINFASQIVLQIAGINNVVSSQSNVIAQNYLNGYRRLNELNSLIFDPDGYFDTTKIKPLSIETNMLSVGAKSQQLTLEEITIEPNYTGDPARVKISSGKLIHFSIDNAGVREWNFLDTTIMGLVDTEVYYLYAKCDKTGVQGEFVAETAQIKFDSQPNYYYFLIGVLHKVANGFRFYTPLEGATMLNGRYITTGRIQSVDLTTWFDLDLAAFDLGGSAGMTGKGGPDGVFLYGGETFDNRDLAPIRFYRNGTGVLKNVSVEGEIIATTGRLGGPGGWYIDDKKLINHGEGNIIFGDVSPAGFLNKGIILGYDVQPSGSYNSNLWINNTEVNPSKINIGAQINASGGFANYGLWLSASGGSVNDALYVESGNLAIGMYGAVKVMGEVSGVTEVNYGWTGPITIGVTTYHFVKGILVKVTNT